MLRAAEREGVQTEKGGPLRPSGSQSMRVEAGGALLVQELTASAGAQGGSAASGVLVEGAASGLGGDPGGSLSVTRASEVRRGGRGGLWLKDVWLLREGGGSVQGSSVWGGVMDSPALLWKCNPRTSLGQAGEADSR